MTLDDFKKSTPERYQEYIRSVARMLIAIAKARMEKGQAPAAKS